MKSHSKYTLASLSTSSDALGRTVESKNYNALCQTTLFFFKNNDYAIYELGSHVGHPFVRVLVQFWPPTAAAKRLCTSHLKALVVKENI